MRSMTFGSENLNLNLNFNFYFILFQSQEISAKVAAETQLVEELDQASRKLESVNQNLEAGKARVEAVESQLNEQNRQLDSALSDRQGHLRTKGHG